MASDGDDRFLVLHALRLKGFADTDGIADLTGLPVDGVERALKTADAEGLAKFRDGRLSGWMLTPDGRALHATLLADELEKSGARSAIDSGYRGFLALNDELKQICTDWQLREGDLNDHGDTAYDRSVIDRLLALHVTVEPVTDSLGQSLARFGRYAPRLVRAARLVDGGDHDWFTGVTIDSYHTVWFQLHEDLLVTLGIDRAEGET
ncbi:MAG: MarR family transcriptional regulator [Acidimicrobiales bacterium]